MYKGMIKYQTDYGYVFPDVKTEHYFQQSSIDVSVDLRVQTGAAKFGQISIFLSKDLTSYARKYTKIQEVIAIIGGFLNAILFIAGWIVGFITRRIFLIRLANDTYVYKGKDKKKMITMATIAEKRKSFMPHIPDEGKQNIVTDYNKNTTKPNEINIQITTENLMTNIDLIKTVPKTNKIEEMDNSSPRSPENKSPRFKFSEMETPRSSKKLLRLFVRPKEYEFRWKWKNQGKYKKHFLP